MLVDKKIIPLGTRGYQAGQYIYWPLEVACENPSIRKPLFMYWHMWAPKLYGSKKNPAQQ